MKKLMIFQIKSQQKIIRNRKINSLKKIKTDIAIVGGTEGKLKMEEFEGNYQCFKKKCSILKFFRFKDFYYFIAKLLLNSLIDFFLEFFTAKKILRNKKVFNGHFFIIF